MTDHWHTRFLDLARHIATWSKDPSTQVGAVIVRPDRTIASVGFNGFPRGVEDYPDRYVDRPTKYQFVVHAEANAILNAHGSVAGCTLYSTLFTCNECAKLIVQAGISQVIAPTPATLDAYGFRVALQMYAEAGVDVVLLDSLWARHLLVTDHLLQFVEQHCGKLTPPQRAMTEWHLKNKTLIGVGRAIGRSVYFPLVQRGPRAPLDVIDAAGYEQTAAKLSGKCPL